MLTDYKGPSSSPEVFQHLVGERIVAAFIEKGCSYIVVESGEAIVFNSGAYWVEEADRVRAVMRRRKAEIERHAVELGLKP